MNKKPTINHGAVCAGRRSGLAGFTGRTVAGAFALLLIAGVFGGSALAITGGQIDQSNAYPNVSAIVIALPCTILLWVPRER